MANYIKRFRENAGLTQEQLAEKMGVSTQTVYNWETGKHSINMDKLDGLCFILNVPKETMIGEILRLDDKERQDNWPGFLFDEETNSIVDSLHLNLAQQDLFGLMYIYDADEEKSIGIKTFDIKLKNVPYGFIEKVGSIRFMNQAEGLKRVLRSVNPEFLLKVLKLDPESEFDVKKLHKQLICEFISGGYINPEELDETDDDYEYTEDVLRLNFPDIMKARIILEMLEEYGPLHMTDDHWSNPIRDDLPEEAVSAILDAYEMKRDLWKEGRYEDKYTTIYIIKHGMSLVTDYKNTARKGGKERWMWSINDKGKELLEWLRE